MAGIGNVLSHDYEDPAPDVLWHVVHDNLPVLKTMLEPAHTAQCINYLEATGLLHSCLIETCPRADCLGSLAADRESDQLPCKHRFGYDQAIIVAKRRRL